LSRARLRGGRELVVLELSNCGALVEGTTRLLPGTHVDVHLITGDGRTLVRGRIVRASVCAVDAEVVRYRGAIAFEHWVDTSNTPHAVPDVLAPVAATTATGTARAAVGG
jgi:hypothetical protein